MSDDLVIKISGDTKGITDAYKEVAKGAEDLGKNLDQTSEAAKGIFASLGLEKIAQFSHEAFDVLKEQLVGSLQAYSNAEGASRELTDSLQNQGIFTEELRAKYHSYADEVARLTGLKATELTRAQATAQSYLGQIPVTKELTQAIADLAQKQGISLPAAAEQLGKAIGDGTGMLLRQGLRFDATATVAERYAQTLAFVNLKAGGFAAAANESNLGLAAFYSQVTANEEALGARFAPAARAAIKALTDFITPSKEAGSSATEMKAIFLAVGLVVTGLGVALPIAAQAFLAVRAAVLALNIQLTATSALFAALGGVLIIAAIAVVTDLALNWDKRSKQITAIVHALVAYISEAFGGVKKVLSGAFHLNADEIKAGLSQIEGAYKVSAETAADEWPKAEAKAQEKQKAANKKAADERARFDKEQSDNRIQLAQTESDLQTLEAQHGSDQLIALKKKEAEILKQLDTTFNAQKRAALKAHLADLISQEQEYSGVIEAIQKALNSTEVKGLKEGTAEVVALTQSKNDTLKTIGKAAAISEITIKTAQSAVNVFRGFSEIPIIGEALGFAAAAAVIAYGAEQIGNVVAAADGGEITGGIRGKDSVHALLMPHELVVPSRNFEEVVGAVQTQRAGGEAQGAASVHVELSLKDKLVEFVEAKIKERQRLGISLLNA